MNSRQSDATVNDSAVTGAAAGGLRASSSRPLAAERRAFEYFLRAAGNPAIAVRLWDGSEIRVCDREPVATVIVANRSTLYRLLARQDVAFGDEYSTGRVDVQGDLVEMLNELENGSGRSVAKSPLFEVVYRLLTRRPRSNTLHGSKANIHHHYDIGNAFYKLWLDAEMQYTCAYFPDDDMSLEAAQVAKMDHVARKLQLQRGDRVVEAGCGWGGLARHFARHYGVKVRAFNISEQQIAYARERAAREGLDDRIEYVLDDYRNASGQYDVFVSVGMLEHVGTRNYRILGGVVDRVLTASGRALIHSIGRNRPEPMNAWIEKRIFPGGYPPTIHQMMDIVEPYRFSVLDIENLRLHYAETLQHWLRRFDAHEEQIAEMFDAAFVRTWRLYLSGSISAFLTSSLQLFQMVFARGTDNSVPRSREHLYHA